MGLASDVITRVRDALLDLGTTYRWTDAELLRWLTDAQREVCLLFPEANVTTAKVTPDAADVRIDMRLRASPAMPIAILRFAASDDELNDRMGYELKLVEKAVLDAFDPGWMGYRPATAALNTPATSGQYYRAAVIDPKDPLAFWLYPRAHNSFAVWVTYTASPAALAATSDALTLGDQYIPVLTDYVLYRALGKDSVYTGAPAKSKEFQDSFMQKLSFATGRRFELSPTKARAPEEH